MANHNQMQTTILHLDSKFTGKSCMNSILVLFLRIVYYLCNVLTFWDIRKH